MNLNGTSLWGNRAPQVPDCALKWRCDGAEARLCHALFWFSTLSPPRCKAWCKPKHPHFSFERHLKHICKCEDF